jgi:hypothetical protein
MIKNFAFYVRYPESFYVAYLTTLVVSRLCSSDFQPVCRKSLGKGRKEAIKNWGIKEVEIYDHYYFEK